MPVTDKVSPAGARSQCHPQTRIPQALHAPVADVRFRHQPVELQRLDRVHLEFRERHVVPRNLFVSVGLLLDLAARSTRSRVSDAVVTIYTREADRVPAGRIASTPAARRLARESFVGGREDGDQRRRPNLEIATMTEAELACRRVCVRHRGRG